ncbi:MAG: hypothetical protein DME54_02570 [Verrucomicrobia bacterium]|nr:MAG: hypothetical protein DME54_02570 [Verrucomicrobiota bacterium]
MQIANRCGIQSCDLIERDTQTHFRHVAIFDINRYAEHADAAGFKFRQKMRDESAWAITLFVQIDQQIEVKIDNSIGMKPIGSLLDGLFLSGHL